MCEWGGGRGVYECMYLYVVYVSACTCMSVSACTCVCVHVCKCYYRYVHTGLAQCKSFLFDFRLEMDLQTTSQSPGSK